MNLFYAAIIKLQNPFYLLQRNYQKKIIMHWFCEFVPLDSDSDNYIKIGSMDNLKSISVGIKKLSYILDIHNGN